MAYHACRDTHMRISVSEIAVSADQGRRRLTKSDGREGPQIRRIFAANLFVLQR